MIIILFILLLILSVNGFHYSDNYARKTKLQLLPDKINKDKLPNDQLYAIATRYDENLNKLYNKCMKIRCPFMKRRSFEAIEFVKQVLQFLLVRHKSIDFVPMTIRDGRTTEKWSNLEIDEIANLISKDWYGRGAKMLSGKGYYITGQLTMQIYSEDCFFDGPDPDMPVKGLRKYLLFASQLFDQHSSRADLIAPIEVDRENNRIIAQWRLEGILNLPWHPTLKPWTGRTIYHIGADGLISQHVEEWDISVMDAFLSTLFPQIYKGAAPAPALIDGINTSTL